MQRIGFRLKVDPTKIDEYLKHHSPIWPELAAELKAAGMRNYTLWIDDDGTEFGYLECDDWNAVRAYLAKSDVHARWQKLMQNYLLTPTDSGQGGQPIRMLKRSFILE